MEKIITHEAQSLNRADEDHKPQPESSLDPTKTANTRQAASAHQHHHLHRSHHQQHGGKISPHKVKGHHYHHLHKVDLSDENTTTPQAGTATVEPHHNDGEHDEHVGDTVPLTDTSAPIEHKTYFGGRVYVDTLKLLYLSICFMTILAAMSTTISLLGPIFKQVGLISLSIQYLGFCIGSLLAPPIVSLLGVRVTMVIGSAAYAGFIYIVQLNLDWVFLIASFIRGFAGGALWNAQAIYVAVLVERHPSLVGRYSGIFFSVYSFNIVLGNLIVGIPLLLSTVPATATPLDAARTTLWILAGIGTLATVLFTLVRPMERIRPATHEPFLANLKNTFGLFKDNTMRYLIWWSFMFGFVICFMWGSVATLFGDLQKVPMLFIVFGVAFLISSFVTGRVFDKIGWKPLLVIYCTAFVVGFILFIFAYLYKILVLYFVVAFIFGWLESELRTLNQSAFIRAFPNSTSHAFALANFGLSFGQALSFLASALLPYWSVIAIDCLLLTIGTFMFYWAFQHIRHDPGPISTQPHGSALLHHK